MSRWYFDFKILFSRKTFRDLVATDPLRKIIVAVRDLVLKVFVSDGLNAAYDWRFPQLCAGDELDRWGETLDLPRESGESDDGYRIRLVNEYTDIGDNLTVKAIEDAINPIIGEDPTVKTHWSLAADWPLDWCNDSPQNFQSWTPWEQLADLLVIVPEGLSSSQLNQIAAALIDRKWAISRALIVEDKTSYYLLKKEVL